MGKKHTYFNFIFISSNMPWSERHEQIRLMHDADCVRSARGTLRLLDHAASSRVLAAPRGSAALAHHPVLLCHGHRPCARGTSSTPHGQDAARHPTPPSCSRWHARSAPPPHGCAPARPSMPPSCGYGHARPPRSSTKMPTRVSMCPPE